MKMRTETISSIHTRVKKIACSAIALVACLFALSACSLPWLNRHSELKNVVWRSESNALGVVIELLALSNGYCPYGFIECDGERVDIDMSWCDSRLRITPVTYYGKECSYSDDDEPQYSSGSYKIIKDNKVELEFLSDDIFAGKLNDKKIVVVAYEIDPADYDIGLRNDVCWENTDEGITLYTHQQMQRFSMGKYGNGEKSKEIVVYWTEGKTFSAYEMNGGEQGEAVLLSGSYEYDGTTLTLNYEKNEIDGSEKSELAARDINVWEFPQEQWYPNTED